MVSGLSEPPEQIEQVPADVPLWTRRELEERIAAGTGGPFGVLWACDRWRDLYGSRRVPDPLRRWLDESRSPVLLQALLERLKQMERDPSIAAAVARRIDDHEAFGWEVLYEALAVLAAHAAAEHLEVFRRYLAHADAAPRTVAVEGVVASGRPEGPDAILGGFAELSDPVAAFFLLQGLFAQGDAGAAERAGRLVVERLAGGALESAYCLGVSLDPLDFGFHLHERATEALYPQLAEPEERSDEDLEGLLVVGSDPAARRLAEAVAPAGVRKRLESLARAGEHLRLVEDLLGLLRRAVALVEEEAPPFAGRARVFLGFLDAAVASPRFVELSPGVHQEFAIWAAGALAHVLRGRDPVRDAEAAREDISAAFDLLATDVSLPPRVTVDIVRRAPIEMIEDLDSELDFAPEGPSACQQMLLGARLPEKCLLDLIKYYPRNEDFRRDLAAVAAQVAGDAVLPICARGLVKGLVELEDFLEALRNLGTRRSREYLKWCWSAVEERGADAARVLDLALACGGAELWREALESFRRGRLQPDVESGRGDLLVRAALLLGLLGIEDDPGAVVESAVVAHSKRRADQPSAETTSAGGEESEEPARPGKGEQREPPGKPVAGTSRGLSGSSRGKLRSGGGPPSIETIRREAGKVGRNDLCPCGSGKKYKRCCGAQV